jgi:hypothetical protein
MGGMVEFKREERYVVLKKSDFTGPEGQARLTDALAMAKGVTFARSIMGQPERKFLVIESDWPEFDPIWEEIQRRMEDKPTIMDEEMGRWQDAIYKLACDLAPDAQIDGGGCDSGDPLDLTLDEISQAFAYWDNLLFDTMESVSHAKIEGSTFKAAAAMITTLAAENEKLSQQVCDVCSPDNYGWVENRAEVERLAAENVNLRILASNVLDFREGDLPTRGWLRDNNGSREALHALAEAVRP